MVAALVVEKRSVAHSFALLTPYTDHYRHLEMALHITLQKKNAQSGNPGRICNLSITELLTASPSPVNIPFQVKFFSLVSWLRVTFAHQLTLANGTSAPVSSTSYANCCRLPVQQILVCAARPTAMFAAPPSTAALCGQADIARKGPTLVLMTRMRPPKLDRFHLCQLGVGQTS